MFIQVPKEHDDLDSEGNPPIDLISGIQETEKHDIKFGTTHGHAQIRLVSLVC